MDTVTNMLEYSDVPYKSKINRTIGDALSIINSIEGPLFEGQIECPTGTINIITDYPEAKFSLGIRNFAMKEFKHTTNNQSGTQYPTIYLLHQNIKPGQKMNIGIRDDNHNIGLVSGNKLFEAGIVTGLASHFWIKKNNIIQPMITHGGCIQIENQNGNQYNILLVGYHGSGKSFTTMSIVDYCMNHGLGYNILGDDRFVVYKKQNNFIAQTTDASISLDIPLLLTFPHIIKTFSNEILATIQNNQYISSYLTEKGYNIEYMQKKGLYNITHSLLDVLSYPHHYQQGNLFYDIFSCPKKIAIQTCPEKSYCNINNIIFLSPGQQINTIDQYSHLTTMGATNHFPLSKEEVTILYNDTKKLLQSFKECGLFLTSYNYHKGEKISDVLNTILK